MGSCFHGVAVCCLGSCACLAKVFHVSVICRVSVNSECVWGGAGCWCIVFSRCGYSLRVILWGGVGWGVAVSGCLCMVGVLVLCVIPMGCIFILKVLM